MANDLSHSGSLGEHHHLPTVDFHHDRMATKLDVTLAADENLIVPTVNRIMEVVSQIDCAKGKEFEIETAIIEALANAVKHGAKKDSSKKVQCIVVCEAEKGMLIVVRDPGEGFNPNSIPDCTVGENIYSDHGRGIYMINQLMDEVHFEKNGTEIHMRKY